MGPGAGACGADWRAHVPAGLPGSGSHAPAAVARTEVGLSRSEHRRVDGGGRVCGWEPTVPGGLREPGRAAARWLGCGGEDGSRGPLEGATLHRREGAAEETLPGAEGAGGTSGRPSGFELREGREFSDQAGPVPEGAWGGAVASPVAPFSTVSQQLAASPRSPRLPLGNKF